MSPARPDGDGRFLPWRLLINASTIPPVGIRTPRLSLVEGSPDLVPDESQEGGMRLFVGGDDKAARAGVDRLTMDPGDHTARCLAEGDTGREVDAVAQVPVGDVGGA